MGTGARRRQRRAGVGGARATSALDKNRAAASGKPAAPRRRGAESRPPDMTIAEFVYTVLLRPRPLRRAANAAIRALLPQKVRVGAATVWINPEDPVISGALTLGVYERGEIAFFLSRFGADMTFIDV